MVSFLVSDQELLFLKQALVSPMVLQSALSRTVEEVLSCIPEKRLKGFGVSSTG